MLSEMNSLPSPDILQVPHISQFRKKHKVFMSFTTSPTRLERIRYVLDSIDTDIVDKIFVNLPMRFARDGTSFSIPSNFQELYGDKVEILRSEKDYGPITKLIPSARYIKSHGDEDAILIIMDDDIVYGKGFVEDVVLTLTEKNNTAVSGSGQNLEFWKSDSSKMPRGDSGVEYKCDAGKEETYCDVLEGFGMIGARVKDIDDVLLEMLSNKAFSRECFLSDDVVISFVFGLHGVEKMVKSTNFMGGSKLRTLPHGFGEDALHHGAGLGFETEQDINWFKYQKCVEILYQIGYNSILGQFRSVEQIKEIWKYIHSN